MATTVAVIAAERWLDEVVLVASLPADTAGAPVNELVALPAGIGDVAIMSVHLRARPVDVGPVAASTVPRGARVFVVSADGANLLDVVGTAEWLLCLDTANNLEYWCTIDPDALCLWRTGETLSVVSPELDSDATPTGDVFVIVKCARVRGVESAPQPIQLVR